MTTHPSDHFSKQANDYAKFRPTYPDELFAWIGSQSLHRGCVWDVATGNGQAALRLVEYFDRVVATDISAQQLENATAHECIDYRHVPAEDSGLPDGSVDAVTVAAAIHWFDFDRFYGEVRRVGTPQSKIFVWAYDEVTVDSSIDPVVRMFYKDIVGPYWPSGRYWVERKYEGLPFPFSAIPTPPFEIRRSMSADEFLGYLGTWSSTARYRESVGSDPVDLVAKELRRVWGKEQRWARWPIFMKSGTIQEST